MALQWGGADLTWGADTLDWVASSSGAGSLFWGSDGLNWGSDSLDWGTSTSGAGDLFWSVDGLYWGANSLAWGATATPSGPTDFYWGADGLYWGDEGLYWAVTTTTPTTPSTSGGAGTTQRFPKKWWDSHKKPPGRKRVVEYSEFLAQSFAEATAADAGRLAENAKTLQRLIAESEYKIAYLEDTAKRLREAAVKAAKAETERLRQEQIAVAAEIAYRLEMELRDEEESIFLLLM